MALINNAAPGSQINLLCMIYRVLHRHPGTYTPEELEELCVPPTLPTKEDHLKRFPSNLKFWMHPSHCLWTLDDTGRLTLARKSHRADPPEIASAVHEAVFASPIDDVFASRTHDTEELMCALSALLATDEFVFSGPRRIDRKTMDEFFAANLPEFSPNNSERPTIMEYGSFLGYLEPDSEGYVADPTRALRGFLERRFQRGSRVLASEFFKRVSEELPLLDGGRYRMQVESHLKCPTSADPVRRVVSASLSIAMERLVRANLLTFEGTSDDDSAWRLQLPGGDRYASWFKVSSEGART